MSGDAEHEQRRPLVHVDESSCWGSDEDGIQIIRFLERRAAGFRVRADPSSRAAARAIGYASIPPSCGPRREKICNWYFTAWTKEPAVSSLQLVPRPADVDPRLGAALRRLRKNKNLTQEDLAHKAGLTVAALARIERGQSNPTWSSICAIAEGLGVKVLRLAREVEREDSVS